MPFAEKREGLCRGPIYGTEKKIPKKKEMTQKGTGFSHFETMKILLGLRRILKASSEFPLRYRRTERQAQLIAICNLLGLSSTRTEVMLGPRSNLLTLRF